MGIFGSKHLSSEVDTLEVDYNKPKSSNFPKQKKVKGNSSKYGIERAIKLVSCYCQSRTQQYSPL